MKQTVTLLSVVWLLAAGCSGSSAKVPSPERDAGQRDAGQDDASVSPQDAGTDGAAVYPMDADMHLEDAAERVLDAGDGSLSDAAANDNDDDAASADASVNVVLDEGFEGALPAFIDPGAGVLTPSQGFADLGSAGNIFGPTFLRSPSPNVVTVTLQNLPEHEALSLSFLFAAIDSLDGEGSFPSGDYFRITLDGSVLFRETFANAIESQVQTYVAPEGVVLARRQDLGFSGPGGYHTDSAYDMGKDPRFQDIPHTASTAVFTFELEGTGVQDLNDESWAIDNLRVSVGSQGR